MQAPGRGRGQTDFRFLIAMAAIVVGTTGAVAGSAIGATAMTYDGNYAYQMPEQGTLLLMANRNGGAIPLPDHYAMDTPEGRIEVAELRSRGLYSSPRYAKQDYKKADTAAWVPAEIEEEATLSLASSPAEPADEQLSVPEEGTSVTLIRGTNRSVATVSASAAERATTAPLQPLFQGG